MCASQHIFLVAVFSIKWEDVRLFLASHVESVLSAIDDRIRAMPFNRTSSVECLIANVVVYHCTNRICPQLFSLESFDATVFNGSIIIVHCKTIHFDKPSLAAILRCSVGTQLRRGSIPLVPPLIEMAWVNFIPAFRLLGNRISTDCGRHTTSYVCSRPLLRK